MKQTNKLIKQVAVYVLVTGLLVACNTNENKKSDLKILSTVETEAQKSTESATELTLNSGEKWNADASTNLNVTALSKIIQSVHPTNLEAYHAAGKTLQEGIDKMIKECKMKGPDHDALHHWLEPLIEKNKILQTAESANEATEAFDFIKNQVNQYEYFFK